MFINLIIDKLLPMQPRLVSSIPRAHCAVMSSKLDPRGYSSTLAHADPPTRKNDSIFQDHAVDPLNGQPEDIQSECLRDAKMARDNPNNHSIDAASQNIRPDPKDKTEGNPTGMGMLEQVGSASGTAKFFDEGGKQGVKS